VKRIAKDDRGGEDQYFRGDQYLLSEKAGRLSREEGTIFLQGEVRCQSGRGLWSHSNTFWG